MKRIALLILSCFLFAGSVFADEVQDLIEPPKIDLSKEIITYDNAKIRSEIYKGEYSDKTSTIRVEYIPMVDEARIYYNTMYVNYDTGVAMEVVRAAIEYFVKSKQYRNFNYLDRYRERYYKGNRGFNMAEYSQHIKLVR